MGKPDRIEVRNLTEVLCFMVQLFVHKTLPFYYLILPPKFLRNDKIVHIYVVFFNPLPPFLVILSTLCVLIPNEGRHYSEHEIQYTLSSKCAIDFKAMSPNSRLKRTSSDRP